MNKVLLLLLLSVFSSNGFSEKNIIRNFVDQILNDLENEIIKVKGNKAKTQKLLYNEIYTNYSPRSRDLVNYMLTVPSSKELRRNLNAALNQIDRTDLANNYEIEKSLAKLFVAIIGSPNSLNFLAPLMKKYEERIRENLSTEIACFKAVSFFCSQIMSTVMIEKIKAADRNNQFIQNKNIYKIIVFLTSKLQKPTFVRDEKNKVLLQIRDSLLLLNRIFIAANS